MATRTTPLPAGTTPGTDSMISSQLKACLDVLSRGAWTAMKRDLGIAQVTRREYLAHLTSKDSISLSAELINQWIASNSGRRACHSHGRSKEAHKYTGTLNPPHLPHLLRF
jgi:hypothetical protein